jgi:ribonuclease P protein component
VNDSAHPQKTKVKGLQRFHSEQRIKTPGTFQKVFKRGVFVKGRLVNLWMLFDPAILRPRIGIVVSKKTHKRAVVRNLWKRRIREAFRRNQNFIKEGTQVLVQSKKRDCLAPDYREIETEMMELLLKTKAVKND